MFKYYIKTAVRYLVRNKGLTLINILGLAIGICIFILIMHYVRHELSYDSTISRQETLGRMEFDYNGSKQAWTTSAMGPDAVDNIAGIKSFTRYRGSGEIHLEYDKIKYQIPSFAYVDSTFLELFDLKLHAGDPASALREPATAVITESASKKIFGDEEAMGKVLTTSGGGEILITGVMEDPPKLHLEFDMLLSFVTLGVEHGEEYLYTYRTYQYATYVLLEEEAVLDTVNNRLDEYFHKRFLELYGEEEEEDGHWYAYLNPVKDVYFARNVRAPNARQGNLQFVRIFILIAVFIILIACINFINISTARATVRAIEVGIKKVVGSGRRRMIIQFLAESTIITLIAALLGLLLVEAVFPEFENIVGGDLRIAYLENPVNLLLILVGIIFVGVIAGLYPAFYLTAFKPVSVLKGEKTRGRSARLLRKILIIFQFAISVVLIIGTIVVYKQLQYIRNKDLGFNQEFVVTVPLNREVGQKREAFRENLLQYPQVEMTSYSYTVPGGGDNWEGFSIDGIDVNPVVYQIDPDYVSLMGMELKEGRDFSWDIKSDKARGCLINEAMVREIDRDSLVGKYFDHPSWYITAIPAERIEIIGILKDFHYKSMRQEIDPLMFVWGDNWTQFINIRIRPDDIAGTLASIEKEWKAISPQYPFKYSFMDENFGRMYRADERLGKIFRYFAALAIFIAMLGLFGLAAFTAEQRTREIGIRKAMGASASGVTMLLVREFTWLVLISSIIAWVLAWQWAKNWLQEFAYRMELSIWIFIIASLTALVIAWITVISQTLKAAGTNPADSLRYE